MPVAGWDCLVEVTGTSTPFSTEPASLVSGKTYQITDATKRVFDPDVAVVVWDNGAPVSASNIEDIDYLFGRVTFTAGYSILGTITFNSGNYLPRHVVDEAHTFRISAMAAMLNDNRFGSENQRRVAGYQDTSMEFAVKASPRADYDDGGGTLELKDLVASGAVFCVTLVIEDTSANEEIHRAVGLLESFDSDSSTEDQVMVNYSVQGTAKDTPTGHTVNYSSVVM